MTILVISAVFIFIVVWAAVQLSYKKLIKQNNPTLLNEDSDQYGIDRNVLLTIVIQFVFGLGIVLVPMMISFRKLANSHGGRHDQLLLLTKALFLPVIILLALKYFRKKDYLRWIKEFEWPNRYE